MLGDEEDMLFWSKSIALDRCIAQLDYKAMFSKGHERGNIRQ